MPYYGHIWKVLINFNCDLIETRNPSLCLPSLFRDKV